jgi:hypothetical protein
MPNAISNLAESFEAFMAWLSANRAEELAALEHTVNGFEHWLRLEFWVWLLGEGIPQDEVGLEYRAELDEKGASLRPDKQKRIDLWVRAQSNKERYHYVEFKVVFPNANAGKMFRQAASDLWYLRHLDKSQLVASVSVVVIGRSVGDFVWERGRKAIVKGAELPAEAQPTRSDSTNAIRWDVWTV